MVGAKVWSGQPRRWWRAPAKGLSGQELVDFVKTQAPRYPDNVKVH